MSPELKAFLEHNWVTLVTTVVSLIVCWVLYRWGTRIRKPRYAVRTINLIEGAKSHYPDLTIRYMGFGPASGLDPLPNFSVATVAFWNAGRETIRRDDVAPADPLLIKAVGDCRILDASIIQSADVNQVAVKVVRKDNAVLITFDHLDHNQGVVIQVLHTGVVGSEITVEGSVINAGSPVENIPWLARFLRARLRVKQAPRIALILAIRMWITIGQIAGFGILVLFLLVTDFLDPAAFANYHGLSAEEIVARVETL